MSSARMWEEYAEALRNLTRAPEAAQRRRGDITARERRERRELDERLRAATQAKERLEHGLTQLDEVVRADMREHGVPVEGPVADVSVPAPASVAEAQAALEQIQEQWRADLAGLAEARRRARERRQRRLRLYARVAAVVGIAVLVAVLVLLVVG